MAVKDDKGIFCRLCGSYFPNVGTLTLHRAQSGELNKPSSRRKILGYWRTHTLWETLSYFRISQETFRAIREGRATARHHSTKRGTVA